MPASLQGDIVAGFRTGQIQLGRSLGIDDLLLTQFRKKRNGHLHLSARKGIHERLKAIGGHAAIIASRATSQFRPEHPAFHVESGSCWQNAGEHHLRHGLGCDGVSREESLKATGNVPSPVSQSFRKSRGSATITLADVALQAERL